MKITDKIEITNEDCMDLMSRYPDKYFDLAIVDPPYGIGESGGKTRIGKCSKIKKIKNKYYEKKNWDKNCASKEYFLELFRVSKNQIIFGANHFIENINLNSPCWIVWDKKTKDNSDFADCELAWTSFNKSVKKFKYDWIGFGYINNPEKEKKIHPTQKPVKLYKWILENFANEKDKILDTHLGSGSIAIACHDYEYELTACELDIDYFELATNRINNHVSQIKLFQV